MEITNKIITFNKYLSLVPPDIIFKHLSLILNKIEKLYHLQQLEIFQKNLILKSHYVIGLIPFPQKINFYVL